MLGVPRDAWRNAGLADELPELCASHHPGTAYVPSTPAAARCRFTSRSGVAHYYGVGAYLRSPGELRKADVKFAPECLGFANIPEPANGRR